MKTLSFSEIDIKLQKNNFSFFNAKIVGYDFSRCQSIGKNLMITSSFISHCSFKGLTLVNNVIRDTTFVNCNFTNTDFENVIFVGCTFISCCQMLNQYTNCKFEHCLFRHNDFINVVANKCSINKTKLTELKALQTTIANNWIEDSEFSKVDFEFCADCDLASNIFVKDNVQYNGDLLLQLAIVKNFFDKKGDL